MIAAAGPVGVTTAGTGGTGGFGTEPGRPRNVANGVGLPAVPVAGISSVLSTGCPPRTCTVPSRLRLWPFGTVIAGWSNGALCFWTRGSVRPLRRKSTSWVCWVAVRPSGRISRFVLQFGKLHG